MHFNVSCLGLLGTREIISEVNFIEYFYYSFLGTKIARYGYAHCKAI